MDDELEWHDLPYKYNNLRYFWVYSNNPKYINFIQARCCCAADCVKELVTFTVEDSVVKLINKKKIDDLEF